MSPSLYSSCSEGQGHHYIQTLLCTIPQLHPSHIVVLIVLFWTTWSYYHGQTRKLSHIPSMGFDLPFLSFFSSIYWFSSGRQAVLKGTKRYGIFKFPEFTAWTVIAGDRASMEDIRRAPDHILSPSEYQNTFFQGKYTLMSSTLADPYQIPIIRETFTQALPLLLSDVHDELKQAVKDNLPQSTDWTSLSMYDTAVRIFSRLNNRVIVGKALCQNPEYIDATVQYGNEIIKVSVVLNMLPPFIRPLVNYCISNMQKLRNKNREFLFPLIEERRRATKEKGKHYEEKPMDLLSWFMDEATDNRASNDALTMGILVLNFGATQTTTAAFTGAIYHVAANPQYAKLIREEAEEVTGRLGWTKDAVDEMLIINSFLKECQRMHPSGEVGLLRAVMQDFTFSNGITVPKGTIIGGAIATTHFDETVYPDPHTFDPLRFVKLEAAESEDDSASIPGRKKYDLTTGAMDWLTFGYGRHACPGRFLAAMELKLMLAHVVMNYDVKFENEGVRPPDMSLGITLAPNMFTKVLFRKRET